MKDALHFMQTTDEKFDAVLTDKIYYDEYSGFFKKTVKVKSLDSFFSLFKNTKDSLLVKVVILLIA